MNTLVTEKKIKPIPFDVGNIRKDFPILQQIVYGKPLIYLDNAATTQKPQVVIDTIKKYYETTNSNIHRGVHHLSQIATKEYEDSRIKIQKFINAKGNKEIIFVRGATEGINLIANSFGKLGVRQGVEIIISAMEHHSNIVPWQMLCEEKKAKLRIIPINDDGEIIFQAECEVLRDDTPDTLAARVKKLEYQYFPFFIRKIVKELVEIEESL